MNPVQSNSNLYLAVHTLSYREGGYFDSQTGTTKDNIAAVYSRMKFGSYKDCLFLARELAASFISKLDSDPHFLDFFKKIKENGEQVVIFAPGYRNVESGSNKLIEIAADLINIELASKNLPTLIVNKLSRMSSNAANYATLSAEERKAITSKTHTISPGESLFKNGVHIIFGDDVKITGSTVDRLREECLSAGALSFSEIYSIQIDPEITKTMPEIEDIFNNHVITGALDSDITGILTQASFRPVQRLLRLVLSKENRPHLAGFLADPNAVPDHALIRLFIGALKNDYGQDNKYQDSVSILTESVKQRKLVDEHLQPLDLSLL